MPAPSDYEYSAAALVTAHTGLLGQIDGGSGAGLVRLRDDSDVLLSEITLTDPAGTVNGTTGQLTLTPAGPDTAADAAGTCTYGEICDSDGTEIESMPSVQGTSAIIGRIENNDLSIALNAEVSIAQILIG